MDRRGCRNRRTRRHSRSHFAPAVTVSRRAVQAWRSGYGASRSLDKPCSASRTTLHPRILGPDWPRCACLRPRPLRSVESWRAVSSAAPESALVRGRGKRKGGLREVGVRADGARGVQPVDHVAEGLALHRKADAGRRGARWRRPAARSARVRQGLAVRVESNRPDSCSYLAIVTDSTRSCLLAERA